MINENNNWSRLKICVLVNGTLSCIGLAIVLGIIYGMSTGSDQKNYSSFTGGNHYYLHTCSENYQHQIFNTMKQYNMKVLRLFLLSTKGYGYPGECYEYDDIENPVGNFNENVFDKLDNTLAIGYSYGIKFIITMHDRWSLGCWRSDAYNEKYKIYTGSIPNTNCNSLTSDNNPTAFYNNQNIKDDFKNRLTYILEHKNPYFSNRTLANLNDVIFAFEPQNEPQRGKTIPINEDWLCEMANHIKSKTNILVGSGGGWESVPFPGISVLGGNPIEKMYDCKNVDLITLHDYQNKLGASISLEYHARKSLLRDKLIILTEFGSNDLEAHINLSEDKGLPWMVWSLDMANKELSFGTPNNTIMKNIIGPHSLKGSKTWQKFP